MRLTIGIEGVAVSVQYSLGRGPAKISSQRCLIEDGSISESDECPTSVTLNLGLRSEILYIQSSGSRISVTVVLSSWRVNTWSVGHLVESSSCLILSVTRFRKCWKVAIVDGAVDDHV